MRLRATVHKPRLAPVRYARRSAAEILHIVNSPQRFSLEPFASRAEHVVLVLLHAIPDLSFLISDILLFPVSWMNTKRTLPIRAGCLSPFLVTIQSLKISNNCDICYSGWGRSICPFWYECVHNNPGKCFAPTFSKN